MFDKRSVEECGEATSVASIACAECLDCHMVDSSEAFRTEAGGTVDYVCPLCASDDCDVFNPNYVLDEDV